MKTATIQIGNSDNKLTQQEWSQFVDLVNSLAKHCMEIHFSGGSSFDKPWQNACWVGVIKTSENQQMLHERLIETKERFKQDFIALTIGETEFV